MIGSMLYAAATRWILSSELIMKPMPPADETFSVIELQQATRNRGMPLEGLRYDITPTGIHYLLTHFDIPAADAASWRVEVTGLRSKR